MPSFLEAPGLAALEAGVAGANVVITGFGATREYFGDHVEYVNPYSPASILDGVKRALARPRSDALKQHILDRYAWEHVAAATRAAYESVL
jgi:glycosyltransferase involved in cell wall biosynthesis